jgi:hypothetical protein
MRKIPLTVFNDIIPSMFLIRERKLNSHITIGEEDAIVHNI